MTMWVVKGAARIRATTKKMMIMAVPKACVRAMTVVSRRVDFFVVRRAFDFWGVVEPLVAESDRADVMLMRSVMFLARL